MKFVNCQQILVKLKLLENPFSGFEAVTCRQRDMVRLMGACLQLLVVNGHKKDKIPHHKCWSLRLQCSSFVHRLQQSPVSALTKYTAKHEHAQEFLNNNNYTVSEKNTRLQQFAGTGKDSKRNMAVNMLKQ
jgi:hypothetical protein